MSFNFVSAIEFGISDLDRVTEVNLFILFCANVLSAELFMVSISRVTTLHEGGEVVGT